MEDIRLAVALIGFVSVAVFAGMYRLLRDRSKPFLDIIAAFIVILIVVYMYTVWGQLWIVRWIPLPSVIILANWFPPLLAGLGAVVWWRLHPSPLARRLPIMLLLVVAAAFSLTYFIPAEPPVCGDKWEPPVPHTVWPVCRQTTPYTCSAAAAATILYTLGVQTSEQEMAQLCLTRSGTTWLGLYHGLSTQLVGTNHRVEFFEGSLPDLEAISMAHPVLLCCQLEPEVAELIPTYVRDGGWIPGMAHSVVYFGKLRGIHVIGDPSRGYEGWTDRDLNTLWTGTGLKISTRKNGGSRVP
ncbi:MAG TPA: hypothetical protein EYG03_01805 [Planctomycetes bacterium]|nr:hypothetical protein [Planctomycetota bacterium]